MKNPILNKVHYVRRSARIGPRNKNSFFFENRYFFLSNQFYLIYIWTQSKNRPLSRQRIGTIMHRKACDLVILFLFSMKDMNILFIFLPHYPNFYTIINCSWNYLNLETFQPVRLQAFSIYRDRFSSIINVEVVEDSILLVLLLSNFVCLLKEVIILSNLYFKWVMSTKKFRIKLAWP